MKYALRAVSSALILAFMLAALGALVVVIVLVVAALPLVGNPPTLRIDLGSAVSLQHM